MSVLAVDRDLICDVIRHTYCVQSWESVK